MLIRISLILALSFPLLSFAAEPVGIILPLSGPASGFSKGCINGIQLAREDFSSALSEKAEFYFEDDQNTPAQTLSAFQKLKEKRHARIFLSWASNTSKVLSPVIEREQHLLFAVATDPAVSTGRKQVFRYWVSAEIEVQRLVGALQKRSLRRIAIVTGQQDGLLSVRDVLRKTASAAGIEIVSDEEISPDSRDFRSSILKIRALKNLDGIFNNLYVGQSGLFARQARDLGLSLPLFAIELYEDPSVLDAANGALEGQFYVNASDGNPQFVKRYMERFPSESIVSAANCYDFVALLAQTQNLSAATLRDHLATLKDFSGAVGTISADGAQSFTLPAVIKVVHGRQFDVSDE